jgi:outer membrane protein assembly factor BamA
VLRSGPLLIRVTATIIAAACLHLSIFAQAANLQLSDIQITGASILSPADVRRFSGLRVGARVTTADLDTAANTLAATGLFAKVEYRYVVRGPQLQATFSVAEEPWNTPILFDNLIWLSDSDLVAAVKKELPPFTNQLPHNDNVLQIVTRLVQDELTARQLPGRAAFLPLIDLQSQKFQYIVKVENPAPKLCDVTVEGASRPTELELKNALQPAVGADYSLNYLRNMASGTLTDVLRRHGYWRGRFEISAAPLAAGPCSGASAVVHTSEGNAYAWERAEWSGNSAIAAADLDRLLGMKPNTLANSALITAGIERVRREYGKNGYLMFAVKYIPQLNDVSRSAVFEMKVSEGPQFRMGTFTALGLSQSDTRRFMEGWKLAPGAIFDDSYPAVFVASEVAPRFPRGSVLPALTYDTNMETRTVNVKLSPR